jgi:hypothetical protein
VDRLSRPGGFGEVPWMGGLEINSVPAALREQMWLCFGREHEFPIMKGELAGEWS